MIARCAATAFGWIFLLALPAVAKADVLADACLDYVNSSEMLKQAPAANRSKWCSCIAEKIKPADHRSVAEVMKLQKDTEAKGQAMGENTVPKSLANAFNLYFEAQGPCLPVMLGVGPGGGTAPPATSAPTAPRPASTSFELVNATGAAISELYVSPTKSKTWGKDILGNHTIENGEAWKITVPQSKGRCNQDLKIVFADDSDAVWENFDLCDLARITLTYDRRTGVTTAKTE
jgi:hypothetical protein